MKRRVEEADVVIIGGGITAAMVAEKLTDEHDVFIQLTKIDTFNQYLSRADFIETGEQPQQRGFARA